MDTHKDIIERFWEAVNNRDWKTFEALVHEDIVYELPQTRERVVALKAFRELNANYPGDWTLSIVRLIVDECQAASQIAFRIKDEEQVGISFFEFKDKKIFRITEFWPYPYEPPVRHSEGVERY